MLEIFSISHMQNCMFPAASIQVLPGVKTCEDLSSSVFTIIFSYSLTCLRDHLSSSSFHSLSHKCVPHQHIYKTEKNTFHSKLCSSPKSILIFLHQKKSLILTSFLQRGKGYLHTALIQTLAHIQ